MLRTCCVDGCGITTAEDIIFFEFPTSRNLRKKWLDVVKSTEKVSLDSALCSRHFEKSDYEYFRGKVRLKRKVVPSIFSYEPEKKKSEEKINNNIEEKNDNKNNEAIKDDNVNISDNGNKISGNGDKVTENGGDITENQDKINENNEKSEENHNENGVKKSNSDKVNDDTISDSKDAADVPNQKKQSNELSDSKKSEKLTIDIKCTENIGDSDSDDELSHFRNSPRPTEPDKQDIEDLLTNYQIENTKPNQLASPVPEDIPQSQDQLAKAEDEAKDPVYIEIDVGQGETKGECVLVMESVQVELDPATLMLQDDEESHHSKEDPISLLTSSDDDDVILEEPKIDTIEVSDETSEDDMPLVRLAKPEKVPKKLAKLLWGIYQYYCFQCQYSTTSKSDYNKHLKTHETVLQMCQACGYTTASKYQFERHARTHKVEKPYKCHLCEYRAKYNMSLVYHMKSHAIEAGRMRRRKRPKRRTAKND